MSRVIVVTSTHDMWPPIIIPGEPAHILGQPLEIAEHIEREVGRRIAGYMDVECGRVAPTETGVGLLRWGAKGDHVDPFRWRYVTAGHTSR